MRHYLIDEDLLKDMLIKAYKYEILEQDGVEAWSHYMQGYAEYVMHYAAQLPKNEGVSIQELAEHLDDMEYSLEDLVDDEIRAFWKIYKEKCGNECQFKFKAKPKKAPVDNH